jgi:hypothetical protein
MAQDDDDKVDNMNPTEAAVARDPPAAEHTVAWAPLTKRAFLRATVVRAVALVL